MSGKSLLKLEAVGYILANHTPEHFPFLNNPANGRNRTAFYLTLTKLLILDDNPQQFKAFVAPQQLVLAELAQVGQVGQSAAPTSLLRQAGVQGVVVGVMRDLRGIASAPNSRRAYGEGCCGQCGARQSALSAVA